MKRVSNYLGLDPSTKSTGWGVMNDKKEIQEYGIIKGRTDNPDSFVKLHNDLNEIIEKYDIKAITIEDTFFSANVDTLKKLVRPSGVILYMVGLHELDHDFIMPSSWRKIVLGNGRASKRESYEFINETFELGFDSFNKYNDITDAIGITWACVDIFE